MTRIVFALLVGGIAAFFGFKTEATPLVWFALGALIVYWVMWNPPWLHELNAGGLTFEPGEAEVVGDVRMQGFHVRYRGAYVGFVYCVALGWRATLGSFKTPICETRKFAARRLVSRLLFLGRGFSEWGKKMKTTSFKFRA